MGILKEFTRLVQNAPWSKRSGHTGVVFDNKMWVIGGGNWSTGAYCNDVWYSSDGTNWTLATASAGFSPRIFLTSLVFDNKMWVIGGRSSSGNVNDVWYSSNGINS